MQALRSILVLLSSGTILCATHFSAQAQNCPRNIDFENGDFTGWTCYTGTTLSLNGQNVMTFSYTGGPVYNQHTMNSSNPGNGMDEYGDFPINCPNGSGYSIRLGNNLPGTEAEGVSYDFTIPAGANIYNLIYHYAVVFQDPGHLPSEQPRLEIEILNLSDGTTIDCSSFTFFANGTILPGFELSPNPGGNTPVWFKRWTAVSINLDGMAGKNIRMFFKTADCTFRRHFGYAYVDVNTECSDRFTGAEFCPDDTSVFVTAPYGYQNYAWHNSSFTQMLGNAQTLTFNPPPASGTTVAVILTPYNGYGCLDTLYTDLTNTLNYTANAGPDAVSCNNELVQIGSPPRAGWVYNWSPVTGLNNRRISNPLANPLVDTRYVLSLNHNGGGCRSTDTVEVRAAQLDNSIQVGGNLSWCIGSGDSTILRVQPADSIQWFNNNIPLTGANQTTYRATQTGIYHAEVFHALGCIRSTTSYQVNISSVPTAAISVNNINQCLLGNHFIFTNSSTNAVGTMTYEWMMGDGTIFNSRDVTHSYGQPGTYQVRMIVSSNQQCTDTGYITVNIYPTVKADFSAEPVCINLPFLPLNNTVEPAGTGVTYNWDFGNGHTSTLRNPLPTVYSVAGTYRVILTATSEKCPQTITKFQQFITVDKPGPAARYPVEYAVTNLPLALQARAIGNIAHWSPPMNLDNPFVYNPVFISDAAKEYTITLTTRSGCVTVDTQLVKINKNIVIYVPNSFTPNQDGLNDQLRPFMIGIKSLTWFKIFNRWGELVFQTSNSSTGWDGRSKGMPLQMQTFVWMLEGTGVDNQKHQAKGSTVLIR
jgi:gliding motility-associated-like protein